MSEIKIVVTGGAGFIGSHIVEYWSEQNAEVHVVDNLRTGKHENISAFESVRFHNVSITDREAVFEIMEGATYVHHLAAMVSVPESINKPLECVEINVNSLLNVLDAALRHRVRKVVHSSSAAVYGDNPESPKNVNMMLMPKTPYGITKLDGEYYLQAYRDNFGLGTISLRYFNVFGPRQDPASQYAAAVPIFIKKAVEGDPIIIYGDGEQTRDFIFVKDVVNANVLAATKPEVTGVYNVAFGQSTSINEIAGVIVTETASNSEVVYQKERPGDIKHSLASIEKTKHDLGFKPRYTLLEGLRDTIRFFSNQDKPD
ncbi:MAG TPA: NAD-dependent epimerase/dehydratase family protein [Candidatus Kryptobacter bacterium]|nr:MAG: dTDP-glucose 4,6-dehydratase [Ignavibacteriae bacterium 37-53-5]HQT90690.1 NAD-dependent epimerase/dehydratase family protein [Candidatus Kryptobacter bacterium]